MPRFLGISRFSLNWSTPLFQDTGSFWSTHLFWDTSSLFGTFSFIVTRIPREIIWIVLTKGEVTWALVTALVYCDSRTVRAVILVTALLAEGFRVQATHYEIYVSKYLLVWKKTRAKSGNIQNNVFWGSISIWFVKKSPIKIVEKVCQKKRVSGCMLLTMNLCVKYLLFWKMNQAKSAKVQNNVF